MIDINTLLFGESLTVEYKEDRKGFSDSDLIEAVVAMSNTEGGKILIGVKDDGEVTGQTRLGSYWANENTIVALVAGNTNPSVMISVQLIKHESGNDIIHVDVLKSATVVGSKSGRYLKRQLDSYNKPQTVPMLPEEIAKNVYVASSTDFSSTLLRESVLSEIDLELVASLKASLLSNAIASDSRDAHLYGMNEINFLKSLHLLDKDNVPNVACMLLFGKIECLESRFPNAFVQFQEMSESGEMLQNLRFSQPLASLIPALLAIPRLRTNSDEFTYQGRSQVIPEYSEKALREAIANALVHRDYTLPSSIQIKVTPNELEITNPGGFPYGITIDELLSAPPTPRNRRLTESLYRLLFVESSGRGVDFIFFEQARYGRPKPDYSSSTSSRVTLRLTGGKANLAFCKMILGLTERLTIEEMLLVNGMFQQRDMTIKEAALLIQDSENKAKGILASLMKKNLVESINIGRDTYFLKNSISPYAKKATTPQRLSKSDMEKFSEAIINTLTRRGDIQLSSIADSVGLSSSQTYRLLSTMEEEGKVKTENKKWKLLKK